MSKSIRTRLTATYLVIIILVLLASSLILSHFFKNYYIDSVKDNLIYEAVLASDMFRFYQPEKDDFGVFAEDIAKIVALDTGARVTVIDEVGRVISDSQFDASKMESHAGRPEVYKALKGQFGEDIRFSGTAGIRMLYVAVPFESGEIKGVIRLSKPLTEVESLYRKLFTILLFSITLTGVAAFFISIFMARRFSQPISDITEAVRDIARGNLKRRVRHESDDELGILAEAVNDMTDYLEKTIIKISEVKNRFEAVLNNTVNAILMLDSEGRITYANPVAYKLFGFNDDYIGRKSVELISNYELAQAIDKVKKELVPVRRNINLHDRGERIIEANIIPVLEGNEAFLNSILIVMNDITEIKRLETVRRDFVANVSHELKTPVAAISGFAETLMEEKGENPENIKEFSQIIYDESQRLKKLIDELLELSRLESGKMPTNFIELDLAKAAGEAVDIIKKRFPERKDDIVLIGKEEVVIEADKEQLMRIMLNLLENAVYYSPQGSRIVLEIAEKSDNAIIKVTDKGEGIPDKEIPRLFERFYRVDKARSRKTGGTGLGLAIVKHLVENNNGIIKVESRVKEGSTFTVILPRKQE